MKADLIKGKVVCCIASGPSLTKQDCEAVEKTGMPIIAVNSSWLLSKDCDFIYAGDGAWWQANIDQVQAEAQYAELWTCAEYVSKELRLNYHKPKTSGFWNSGMRAIQFAIEQGAKKIILLGYDGSLKNGVHWHGLHENTSNPTKAIARKWNVQFCIIEQSTVEIVNCSKYTEISAFKKDNLENHLKC